VCGSAGVRKGGCAEVRECGKAEVRCQFRYCGVTATEDEGQFSGPIIEVLFCGPVANSD
jgi:hypothetical protein